MLTEHLHLRLIFGTALTGYTRSALMFDAAILMHALQSIFILRIFAIVASIKFYPL